jgi:hypothetical protein
MPTWLIVVLVIVAILIVFGLLYKFTNLKNNIGTLTAAVNIGDAVKSTGPVPV